MTGEGLQNLDLCSALTTSELWGIFIVPHLLWHRVSDLPVSSGGPPHSVASYTHKEYREPTLVRILTDLHSVALTTRKKVLRTYSNLDPHRSRKIRVLWKICAIIVLLTLLVINISKYTCMLKYVSFEKCKRTQVKSVVFEKSKCYLHKTQSVK
jgi:hypothetical protein